MEVIRLDQGQLGARLRADGKGLPKVLQQAVFSAAQRGRSYLIGKSPVDRGLLKVAWRVVKQQGGADLINDQPYAGVIEQGARPFKISREGREALKAWVKRKILGGNISMIQHGASTRQMPWKDARKSQLAQKKVGKAYKLQAMWNIDEQADSIAWAIAKKFEKVGIKGRRFVYMALPQLAELMDQEVNRYLSKFFNRTNGSTV